MDVGLLLRGRREGLFDGIGCGWCDGWAYEDGACKIRERWDEICFSYEAMGMLDCIWAVMGPCSG